MPDQVRITNGRLSVGVSVRDGAWIELTDEATGENLVKNRRDAFLSPLSVFMDGSAEPAHPAERPRLSADGLTLACIFPRLGAPGMPGAEAEVVYTLDAALPRLTLRARVRALDGAALSSVRFPCLPGVWLGAREADNVLITPFRGGERIERPSETLAAKPPYVDWKWQDYDIRYPLSGPCGEPDGEGRWVREAAVSGGCAALFCDLSNPDGGLSFFCDDPACGVRSLRVDTYGESCPGLTFSFSHPASGASWDSPSCGLLLHAGSWREGVDAWRGARTDAPAHPAWFRGSAGLVTHYDFQYQSGEIVHRFADLPALYSQTQALGLSNIMLAGWHEGGFDRGFPRYRANALLGGEDGLREAVAEVRRAGGHATFYVNARLCNAAYPEFASLIEEAAERGEDGRPILETYGADGLTFACMCPQAKAWRDVIVDAARYLTRDIGADGLYLDQLAAAPPKRCRGAHGDFDGWNRGCRQLLREVRAAVGPDVMILVQGVAESAGGLCDGMLTASLSSLDAGSFPAFYRYLHPEQTLVEMMNPRKFSGMRPESVARHSSDLMDRALLLGAYAWIYDLEGDNTFRLDPPQHERLRKVQLLRKAWLDAYGAGTYRDGAGVASEGLDAARYDLADGSVLLVCANPTGRAAYAEVSLPGPARAFARTLETPETETETACDASGGAKRVTAPASALSIIHILSTGSGESR